MKSMKSIIPSASVLVLALASCGESSNSESTGQETITTSPSQEDIAAEESVSDTLRLEIHGNDQMKYNKDRLRAKAGQIVILTLKHVGELPESGMGHNWVLLKKGSDKAAFAQEAMNAEENDYIPEGRSEDIIAYTEMIGGGESTTITFEAPRKGIYEFICTFPGHYMNMKGKFIVE